MLIPLQFQITPSKVCFPLLLCLHIAGSHEQQVTDLQLERGQLVAYWIFRSKVAASLKTSWSPLRPIKIHVLITDQADVPTDVLKGKLSRGWCGVAPRSVTLRSPAAGKLALQGLPHIDKGWKNNVFSSYLLASSSFRGQGGRRGKTRSGLSYIMYR